MDLQVAGLLIVGPRQSFSLMNRYYRRSFSLMNRYYWQSVRPRIRSARVGNEGAGVRRGLWLALWLHPFRFRFPEQEWFRWFRWFPGSTRCAEAVCYAGAACHGS